MAKKGGGTMENGFNRKKINKQHIKSSRLRNYKEQKGIFNKNDTNHNIVSAKKQRREQKKLEKKMEKKERNRKLRARKRIEVATKMNEE